MSQKNINNNTGLIVIIVLLLLIIACGAFFIGKNMSWNIPNGTSWNTETIVTPGDTTPVEITIISDTRCWWACDTTQLITQLKQVPSLAGIEIVERDYSEKWVKELLESSWLLTLPAAIFSKNTVPELTTFLKPTSDWKYYLDLGQASTYDPTIERSERGFRLLSEENKEIALKDSHFTGAENGKIVWLEYTDVNCHYCKKMETDGTAKAVLAKFPNDVRRAPVNFIGVWWAATQNAAEIFECIAKIWWSAAYNSVISQSLSTGKNGSSDLYNFAREAWADATKVESCVKAGESKAMVASKFNIGQTVFGVTGTPGNIIINIETNEYELISWAYPEASFVEVIERMLK